MLSIAMAARPTPALTLLPPCREWLARYRSALVTGWSPNNVENVSAVQLAAIDKDPEAFLRSLTQQGGHIHLPDGARRPRLPYRVYWITDGDFCGVISLRWQPGSDDLPPYVLGHIGYAVVPWKRGNGYATEALARVLLKARQIGLGRLQITTEPVNLASCRVIEANGGTLVEEFVAPDYGPEVRLRYAIDLAHN
jgi:predicted acetyltransferase